MNRYVTLNNQMICCFGVKNSEKYHVSITKFGNLIWNNNDKIWEGEVKNIFLW